MKYSDGQSEFSRVFYFAILCYLRISRKLYAREKLVFYSSVVRSRQRCVLGFHHTVKVNGEWQNLTLN